VPGGLSEENREGVGSEMSDEDEARKCFDGQCVPYNEECPLCRHYLRCLVFGRAKEAPEEPRQVETQTLSDFTLGWLGGFVAGIAVALAIWGLCG
jgi:hypothetical protein